MRDRRRVAILTRATHDNARTSERLRAAGVSVIELPCVGVHPVEDHAVLADAIRGIGPDDWLVVTSRAGADAVARAAKPRCRVAAVGRATAARLERSGIAVEFQPGVASGAALGRELPAARVAVLARSDRALPDLPGILRQRGFIVREVVAYRTEARADGDVDRVRAVLADDSTDVHVFVASPSAVDAFVDATGDLASVATFHVPGPTTEAAVRARLQGVRVEHDEEVKAHVTHR